MTHRRGRRRSHADQQGLTLIELLVTIAVMAGSLVFVVGAFANSERAAAITTDQSNLEVTMRQITDFVRQTYVTVNGAPAGSKGLQYIFCAKSSSNSSAPAGSYAMPSTIGVVPGPVTQILSPGGPVTAWSIKVVNGQSADRKDVNGNLLPAPFPFMDCATGVFNPQAACSVASNCDWGVQQLVISVTFKTGRSLSRTIFKSEST